MQEKLCRSKTTGKAGAKAKEAVLNARARAALVRKRENELTEITS